MKFKRLNENYEDDIKRVISNILTNYQSLRDDMFSLEYYLEDDYESEANIIRTMNYDLEDFGNDLKSEIDDIKHIISGVQEEEEDPEEGWH